MHYSILAFDFGMKHIGVAVAQTVTNTARAIGSFKAKNGIPNWQEIQKLIHEIKPKLLVVGLPLNMDLTQQSITPFALNFAKEIEKITGIKTVTYDERLSTKEAKQILFEQGGYKALKKDKIDALSACLILQSFLENRAI